MALQRIGAHAHVTDSADEVLVTFLDTDTGLLKNVLIRGDATLHARFSQGGNRAQLDADCFAAAETQDAAQRQRNIDDAAGQPQSPPIGGGRQR